MKIPFIKTAVPMDTASIHKDSKNPAFLKAGFFYVSVGFYCCSKGNTASAMVEMVQPQQSGEKQIFVVVDGTAAEGIYHTHQTSGGHHRHRLT